MIFDPKVGALYGDDGVFIKKVSCPLALHPDQLKMINDRERFCSAWALLHKADSPGW